MFIRNAWYVAAWSRELGERPLARTILDEPLVLFRDRAGRVAALEDRCCHRGTPLRFGELVDAGLQCGYHGLVFDASGACVHVPGQERIPPRARVRSWPVVEKNAFVWIWMGDPQRADPTTIVDYPFHDDRARWPHKSEVYRVRADYMLMVDNLMDLTHLGYVHRKTIGGNPKVHVEAQMTVTRKENGLHFIRWMLDSQPPPTYVKAAGFRGRVDRWQEFEWVAPASVLQWSGALDVGKGAQRDRDQGGFQLRIFHALTPETEGTCFYFWSAANGYRQDDPDATEQLFREIDTAFQEDKAIVEAQQERLARSGQDRLVDIASDSARTHMRRTVARLLAEEDGARAPLAQGA